VISELTQNRKGHYGRALEEAVQTQKSQWPRKWNHVNPLHGGRNFNNMAPTDRVTALLFISPEQLLTIHSSISSKHSSCGASTSPNSLLIQ
jgi:hypothetical protein